MVDTPDQSPHQSWHSVECCKLFKCSLQIHSLDLLFESDQSWHLSLIFISILCWSEWGNPRLAELTTKTSFLFNWWNYMKNKILFLYFTLSAHNVPDMSSDSLQSINNFVKFYLLKLLKGKYNLFIIFTLKDRKEENFHKKGWKPNSGD